MKTKILLAGITILFLLPPIKAQVTIGSGLPSREGTLLDLKENENTKHEANSKKGLGLPRVALSSLSTLTVDVPAKAKDYVGLTVYNITENDELTEGTYCWFGSAWKQIVFTDDAGVAGDFLQSNGKDSYYWADISIPAYKFWKPTQKAFFEKSKAENQTYTYEKVVYNNGNYPEPGLFDNDFVYTETMNVKTDASSDKFVLVELTANILKKTINDKPAESSFWEQMQIEILLNDDIVKTYQKIFSNPTKTIANSTFDLFTIIPLADFNLDSGSYTLKVRISNIANSYNSNVETNYEDGKFERGNVTLLDISLSNFGFILYEEE